MAKPTPNEVKERKEQIIKLGKDVATMTQSQGWKYLDEKLIELEESAKEDIHRATSWDDFLVKKGIYAGLSKLRDEVAKTISRSQNAEKAR